MATDKKLYINKDTEFAEGISITQGGKPIGGGDGLPIERVAAPTVLLSTFYEKYSDSAFYFEVVAASSQASAYSGVLRIGYRSSNNTYTLGGWVRSGANGVTTSSGFKNIYKIGIAATDFATLTLASIIRTNDDQNVYGKAYSPWVERANPSDAAGLAVAVQISKSGDPETTYHVSPSASLLFDGTATNQVLGREGQWITPAVAISSPERRAIATPDSHYEVRGEGYYTLNCDEIVKFIKAYNKDVNIKWYQYNAIDGKEYDGFLETDFEKGLTGITCSGYDSLRDISVTLFTYNLMTNQFEYINTDFKVRLTTNSSVDTYMASLAPADAGLSPSQVKFFVQITPGTKTSVTMDENHEIDVTNAINTNIINNIPVGTKLYEHDIMGGTISDSMSGGYFYFIGGYIISTNSTPITDITTLNQVVNSSVYCSIDSEDNNVNSCTITGFRYGSHSGWMSIEKVDYSALPVWEQLWMPTLSNDIMDTVTEL